MKCAVGLLLLVVVALVLCSSSVEALRLRGEPYEGLQNVDVHPNPKLQKTQFKTRIVGGEVVDQGFAPYTVSLQNTYGNHFCAGTIIEDDIVITAASCLAGLQPSNIYVVAGNHSWMGLAWAYQVQSIHIHCNFDKPLYHNDIALIKTATKFDYDEHTQKIDIAKEDELTEGESLTLLGWGSWVLGQHYPEDLKQLQGTYMSYESCRKMYSDSGDVDVGHVCVLPPSDEGACHGDTGGPLVNSKGQLVGLSNWGVPCGRGFPDVYARLAYYNDWIRTTINGCNIPY